MVVGASVGGSVALMSAVRDDCVATAVDLSGPIDWPGIESVRKGKTLAVPIMGAMATSEGAERVDGMSAIVDNAPDGSRFVSAEQGHGYDLVFDQDGTLLLFADALTAWIRG